MIISFIIFDNRNQNKPLNPSDFFFVSSVQKAPSLFLELIHGLVPTFLETLTLSCCFPRHREEARKHCTLAFSSWSNKTNISSVIIFIKLKEMFSGLYRNHFFSLWNFQSILLGRFLYRTNSIQNELTQVYLQQKYFETVLRMEHYQCFQAIATKHSNFNFMKCNHCPRPRSFRLFLEKIVVKRYLSEIFLSLYWIQLKFGFNGRVDSI